MNQFPYYTSIEGFNNQEYYGITESGKPQEHCSVFEDEQYQGYYNAIQNENIVYQDHHNVIESYKDYYSMPENFNYYYQDFMFQLLLEQPIPVCHATTEKIEAKKRQLDLRPFVCHVCNRKFARKHDLQRHIRVHTGDKPYVCSNCKKSFARTDALKRHLRIEDRCRTSPIIQALKKTGNKRYRNL